MKQVNFDYVNFDEYLKLCLAIDGATLGDPEQILDIDKVEEMYEQKKKYEYNLSLYFELVSAKGGVKFAKKGHHELNERLDKTLNSDESEIEIDNLVGNSWRHDIDTYVRVDQVSTKNHPFKSGDRLRIVALEGGTNEYSYVVVHESSNDESTFIINDEELV